MFLLILERERSGEEREKDRQTDIDGLPPMVPPLGIIRPAT